MGVCLPHHRCDPAGERDKETGIIILASFPGPPVLKGLKNIIRGESGGGGSDGRERGEGGRAEG